MAKHAVLRRDDIGEFITTPYDGDLLLLNLTIGMRGCLRGRLRRELTSSCRMGQIRTDLASAATSEPNVRIDYLNAVTTLERAEVTMLER